MIAGGVLCLLVAVLSDEFDGVLVSDVSEPVTCRTVVAAAIILLGVAMVNVDWGLTNPFGRPPLRRLAALVAIELLPFDRLQ